MTDQQPADMPDWERRLNGGALDAQALRDRIADAITAAVRHRLRPADRDIFTSGDSVYFNDTGVEAVTDAVMAVVQAALEQQAADIDGEIIRPERALHEETIQRAEQAEADRDSHQALAWVLRAALDAAELRAALTPDGEP